MAISTLNEYYSSKGQALPSVSERQGMAAQAGIQNYTGTAQQNTQLLSSLMSNQGNQTAVPNTTIPAPVAVGTTTPVNLPNRPTPQEPSNLYTQAAAIIASLPKTGVAGIDQANQALAQLPGQLYEQQGIGAKQTAANEAQTALKLFEEETRQKLERERTNAQLGAETLASRSYAIEKDRAFMAGTLAIKAAAANQDFETAMSVMKTMSDMITEPLRQTRDFFKEMYMKTEDQRFQRAMKSSDQAFQREMKLLDVSSTMKTEAMKQGIPYDVLSKANTPDQVAKATIDYKKSLIPPGFEKVKSENLGMAKLLVEYNNFIKDKTVLELKMPDNAAKKGNLISELSAEYKDAKKLGTLDAGVERVIKGLIGDTGTAKFSTAAQSAALELQLKRLGYDTSSASTSGINLFNKIKQQVSAVYNPSQGFIIPGKTQ